MPARTLFPAILAGCLIAAPAGAAEPTGADAVTRLSPGLRDLLRAEMREVALGTQGLALAIASGDWQSIRDTGARIRASYILEKGLTPEQSAELEAQLPERFKQLDAQFHQRADKIAAAAATRDTEQVVFHYARLLEGCGACHAGYAQARFPGFAPPAQEGHHH